jgi:UDP-glucose 4-epimerase
MKKVVVFGGSGFLGSHIADSLTDLGYIVTIFDVTESQYLRDSQKMIVSDVMDREAVKAAVSGNDIVYHCASIADIAENRLNPVESAQKNIIGSLHILDACKEFKVKRFVFASTIYVYSDHGSFYRSSKQACELFIDNYQKEYNLDFTILRYGSLYGTRANEFNFIKNAITSALVNGKIERQGDGQEIRDYINVIDAATCSVDILADEYRNKYIMVTGPQTMRVSELLEMINEMLRNQISIEYFGEPKEGHYKITPYTFKPEVALKIIPKEYHDLGQGILECIYNNYEELIKNGSHISIKL